MGPLVPLAVQGALGLAQLVGGALSKPKRPVMPKRTAATSEAVSTSRMRAQSTSDAILQGSLGEIDQSAANAASTLRKSSKDVGDLIGGASRIQAGTDTAKRGARMDFAQRQDQNFFNFMRQLAQASQEEREAFDWNQAQKYQEQAGAKAALLGGGIQNMAGALGDMSALSMYRQMGILPNTGGSTSAPVANPNISSPIKSLLQNTAATIQRSMLPKDWQNPFKFNPGTFK